MLHGTAKFLSRGGRRVVGRAKAAHRIRLRACSPSVQPLEGRLMLAGNLAVRMVAAITTDMTAQARMASFGLTHVKGLAYTPEPSDDVPTTPANYFDSDFWNNAFTPMWSSKKDIPGFQLAGGKPVNGRGDLASIKSLGVNFLHIYDWNSQRDHTPFLNQASADGISADVPISNYNVQLAVSGNLNPGTYVYQLQNVQSIFNQVYPNWQSGNFTPVNGIKMWLVTNEPDISGIAPTVVTQLMQEVLYCENAAGIPDADRLPIGVPFSYATTWNGVSGSNPTPGVFSVQTLYGAITASAAFTANTGPSTQVTVPALPSDFFTTRFVWGINPLGNNIKWFLGQETGGPYSAYNNPVGASTQINWNAIPLVFTELGPNSVQANQPEVLKSELASVKWAENHSAQDPTFDGAMVFQSLDQVAHKTGPESHWGIETIKKNDFKEITDVPPTIGLSNGSPVSDLTWRLDVLEHKPAWAVVQAAFGGGQKRR